MEPGKWKGNNKVYILERVFWQKYEGLRVGMQNTGGRGIVKKDKGYKWQRLIQEIFRK